LVIFLNDNKINEIAKPDSECGNLHNRRIVLAVDLNFLKAGKYNYLT